MWKLRPLCAFPRRVAPSRPGATGERSIKSLVSVQLVCANGENPNDAASTFSLALWQSATQDEADQIQEQEVDCHISDYTKALESDPNNATAYLGRGIAHLKAFNFDVAIADFTKAIELEPNDASAYTNRGSAHYEKAEFAHAIADLNKALELNPKSALAYCNLGWTYEAMGDERKAIAHYRKALEIDPSVEAARDNLTLLGATPEH
jgi:tetratricopeptide (TPR) repeat protein